MSFISKNLHSRKDGMGFIKGATLFFLGMSCIFFVTKAFEITPIINDTKAYFKTLIFTASGSNAGSENITLDGMNGDGYFAGTVTGTKFCLSGDSCITTWPTGSVIIGGGDSIWSTGALSSIHYTLGNVGIGTTTTPTQKLEVNGNMKFTSEHTWIGFSENQLYFGTGGDMGIGTDIPTEDIQVKNYAQIGSQTSCVADGSEAIGGYFLRLYAGQRSEECSLVEKNKTTPNIQLNGYKNNWMIDGGSSLRFSFSTGTYNYQEFMRISSGGDVGIGTGVPEAKLHIYGTTLTIPLLSVTKDNNSYLHVANNGNVGIGIDTPGYRLDVSGSGYVSDNLIINKDVIFSGNLVDKKNIGNQMQFYKNRNTDFGTFQEVFNLNLDGQNFIEMKQVGLTVNTTQINSSMITLNTTFGVAISGGVLFLPLNSSNPGIFTQGAIIYNTSSNMPCYFDGADRYTFTGGACF